MQELILLLAIILLPLACAGLFLLLKGKMEVLRTPLIIACCAVMAGAAIYLSSKVLLTHNRLIIPTEELPSFIGILITAFDVAILGAILYFGLKLKSFLVTIFTLLQVAGFAYFEFFMHPKEPINAINMDYLSVILLLLSSIVGSIVAIYAIGYMKGHEHHLNLAKSQQPRFFAVVFLFLSAMNALAITDNLSWLYTFWEITTLCSFLLISHDKTDIAIKNATRALWMNSIGGVAFILAIIILYANCHTIQISDIVSLKFAQNLKGNVDINVLRQMLTLGVALLCFAGFTKSAQFPFQKWLLGAMVAPTPVSALLHSSTMVKAGVFLLIRFSPLFGGTLLGTLVSIVGAFTFTAASAIAISQSNGKKVLAYSTIANLGLIIACCGIGNSIAISAAILLLIYHAVSKGLLFLCMGVVELEIGSRNIEDMQGMFKKMPFTTITMVIGMLSMLLPPFGVLATKWMAIEAAVYSPIVMLLIIVGSAFTIVFWVQWIGIILTTSHKTNRPIEKLPTSIGFSFVSLLVLIITAGAGINQLFNMFVSPQLSMGNAARFKSVVQGINDGLLLKQNNIDIGGFFNVPMFFILAVVFIAVLYLLEKGNPVKIIPPYVGGELANDDIRGIEFVGPMDKVAEIEVRNYYLEDVFSESKLAIASTVIAIALIIVMFGVII